MMDVAHDRSGAARPTTAVPTVQVIDADLDTREGFRIRITIRQGKTRDDYVLIHHPRRFEKVLHIANARGDISGWAQVAAASSLEVLLRAFVTVLRRLDLDVSLTSLSTAIEPVYRTQCERFHRLTGTSPRVM